jgi:hypothetical protein
VERLRADDRVREPVGERDPLRGTIEDGDVRDDALEDPPHPGGRFDRDPGRPERGERPGELPGTASDVDNDGPGAKVKDTAQVPNPRRRIPWAPSLVRFGRAVEAAHHPVGSGTTNAGHATSDASSGDPRDAGRTMGSPLPY